MNILLNNLKKHRDVICFTYPFPTGRLYIFGNNDSIKLVQFGHCVNHKREIEKNFKISVNDEIGKAVKFLDNYLLGKNSEPPVLDLEDFSRNEKRVYDELIKISFGNTISYKELSVRAGIKNGARFIGNTMAKNLFPIFIPCHRVVNSNGAFGNFQAGREIKKFLLQHESVLV